MGVAHDPATPLPAPHLGCQAEVADGTNLPGRGGIGFPTGFRVDAPKYSLRNPSARSKLARSALPPFFQFADKPRIEDAPALSPRRLEAPPIVPFADRVIYVIPGLDKLMIGAVFCQL